jgi:hypothetical protein
VRHRSAIPVVMRPVWENLPQLAPLHRLGFLGEHFCSCFVSRV